MKQINAKRRAIWYGACKFSPQLAVQFGEPKSWVSTKSPSVL